MPAKIQAAMPVAVARGAGTANLHASITKGQRG